ncbi:MAG: hypothetical protein RLZZ367_644 [Bacteroidota bacterium]|jgi:hypothetical protein
MKKNTLLYSFVLLLLFTKANDTLTRAQVYNFQIGDTFEYHIQPAVQCTGPGVQDSYSRKIIIDKYYSINSDTLFYVAQIWTPSVIKIDTQILSDLQGYEIYLDSFTFPGHANYFVIDTNSYYNGKVLNSVETMADFAFPVLRKFVSGLGEVYTRELAYPSCYSYWIKELTFYSNGNEKWGTSLYQFNSIGNKLANDPLEISFSKYSNGDLSARVKNASSKIELQLYNCYGESIATRIVEEGENQLHFESLPAGIYIWAVNYGYKYANLGKMIVY